MTSSCSYWQSSCLYLFKLCSQWYWLLWLFHHPQADSCLGFSFNGIRKNEEKGENFLKYWIWSILVFITTDFLFITPRKAIQCIMRTMVTKAQNLSKANFPQTNWKIIKQSYNFSFDLWKIDCGPSDVNGSRFDTQTE